MKSNLKYFSIIIIIILFCIIFICCSHDSTVSISKIQKDVENSDLFSPFKVETTNFSIIKRQTNIENKEDIIFVTISGKNEDYELTRNYKLQYVLYNEGWILENIETYYDEIYPNHSKPLHGMNEEDVLNYFNNLNLDEYTSFRPEFCNSIEVEEFSRPSESNLDKGIEMVKEYYYFTVTYKYNYFNEIAIIPIGCEFFAPLSNGTPSWDIFPYTTGIKRSAELNEGILGKWQAIDDSNMYFYKEVTMNISSFDKNGCEGDYLYIYPFDEIYEQKNGHMTLDYSIDDDDGKIDIMCLRWDDDEIIKLNNIHSERENNTVVDKGYTLGGNIGYFNYDLIKK